MKYESYLNASFDEVLTLLSSKLDNYSATLTLEHTIDFNQELRVSVRSFERYSAMGGNRVSANCTLIETRTKPYIIITTTGGSQALFYKINTTGEERFMYLFTDKILAPYLTK